MVSIYILVLSHIILVCHFLQQCKFILFEHSEWRKLIMLSFSCTGWPTSLDNSKILLQGGKKEKCFISVFLNVCVWRNFVNKFMIRWQFCSILYTSCSSFIVHFVKKRVGERQRDLQMWQLLKVVFAVMEKTAVPQGRKKQPYSYFILCMYTSEQLEKSLSWESSLLLMIVLSFIYLSVFWNCC